jgi:ubiquinone/menaquinone biosynthesis C-methylase UbiE
MAILRRDDPYRLIVGMTGVQMGDRIAQVGCPEGGRLAAIAGKVGLSGRAVAVVPDEVSAARARKAAAREGVLLELEIAPPTKLPLADAAFDLVVVDDTGALLGGMGAADRDAAVREALRLLRPGGRVMVIGSAPRPGLLALFTRAEPGPRFDPTPVLQTGGCKAVRVLAERDGLVFVEGMKPGA